MMIIDMKNKVTAAAFLVTVITCALSGDLSAQAVMVLNSPKSFRSDGGEGGASTVRLEVTGKDALLEVKEEFEDGSSVDGHAMFSGGRLAMVLGEGAEYLSVFSTDEGAMFGHSSVIQAAAKLKSDRLEATSVDEEFVTNDGSRFVVKMNKNEGTGLVVAVTDDEKVGVAVVDPGFLAIALAGEEAEVRLELLSFLSDGKSMVGRMVVSGSLAAGVRELQVTSVSKEFVAWLEAQAEVPRVAGKTAIKPADAAARKAADALFDGASEAYGRGELKKALEGLDRAIQLDPGFGAAYTNRGVITANQGAVDEALGDFDQAVRFNAYDVTAWGMRGLIHYKAKHLRFAIHCYDRVLSLQPENVKYLGNRAKARSETGDLKGSLEDYDQYMELEKGNAVAYNNRGLVRFELGDVEGALEDYAVSLKMDPKSAMAWSNKAGALLDLGRYDEAVEAYGMALEIDPKRKVDLKGRASVQEILKNWEGAIGDYDRILEIDPRDAEAFDARGFVKDFAGDTKGAVADLTLSLEIDPDNEHAWFNRGAIHQREGRWKEAADDFRNCLKSGDEYTNYSQLYLWLCQGKMGEMEAATKDFEAFLLSIEKGGENRWFHHVAGFLLGRVNEEALFAAVDRTGDEDEGAQDCEAWYYVGLKRMEAGDKKGAVDAFGQCVATDLWIHLEYAAAKTRLEELR